jgi:hypothetical protein
VWQSGHHRFSCWICQRDNLPRDRQPTLKLDLSQIIPQTDSRPFEKGWPREGVMVRHSEAIVVADQGEHRVLDAGAAMMRITADACWSSIRESGNEIKEVPSMLDEDSSTLCGIPEPMVGR